MKSISNDTGGIYTRRPQKVGRFYIDNEIIDRGYLGFLKREWSVYTVLARHANAKSQSCFPSYNTIMKESGIKNRNRIAHAIRRLQSLNMILVKQVSGTRSNVYYLIDSSQWRPMTSITGDTDGAVSKSSSNQYHNKQSSSIRVDTLNQQRKSTMEISKKNKETLNKMREHLRGKLGWPKR